MSKSHANETLAELVDVTGSEQKRMRKLDSLILTPLPGCGDFFLACPVQSIQTRTGRRWRTFGAISYYRRQEMVVLLVAGHLLALYGGIDVVNARGHRVVSVVRNAEGYCVAIDKIVDLLISFCNRKTSK